MASPQSEYLAACCGRAVLLWSPLQGTGQACDTVNEGSEVYTLDWSNNNKVLAVGGARSQLHVYRGDTRAPIAYLPDPPNSYIDVITCMRFGSDSRKIALGCKNRTMVFIDLKQQRNPVSRDWQSGRRRHKQTQGLTLCAYNACNVVCTPLLHRILGRHLCMSSWFNLFYWSCMETLLSNSCCRNKCSYSTRTTNPASYPLP
jgi:WD40 repeat protein